MARYSGRHAVPAAPSRVRLPFAVVGALAVACSVGYAAAPGAAGSSGLAPARAAHVDAATTEVQEQVRAEAAAYQDDTADGLAHRFEAGRAAALRASAQAHAAADQAAAEAAAAAAAAEAQGAAEAQRAAEADRVARDAQRQAVADAAVAAANSDPRSAARAMLAEFGFADSQFRCLDSLWTKESGWNPSATNRSSGAYGIPQSLPASKMASAGADYRTNPVTQIRWGLTYISASYGSPCNAWAHSQAVNWY